MKVIYNKKSKKTLEKKDIDFVFAKLGFSTNLEFEKNREPLPNRLYTLNDQENTTTLGETKVDSVEFALLMK